MLYTVRIEAERWPDRPRNWHEVFWPRRMYNEEILFGFNFWDFIFRVWIKRA